MSFLDFKNELLSCRDCEARFGFKPVPILFGSSSSKIYQISQAPSQNVHLTKKPFTDNTGKKLKYEWYQVSDETFYNPDNLYISSYSHCFPGKNKNGGDKVPTAYCANKWLEQEMGVIDNLLYIIIGRKISSYLFPGVAYEELIFRDQKLNGKTAFVLPHPSPLNAAWFKRNPDFEKNRMVYIRKEIWKVLGLF